MNVNKGVTAEQGIHQPSGRLDWNGRISVTVWSAMILCWLKIVGQ